MTLNLNKNIINNVIGILLILHYQTQLTCPAKTIDIQLRKKNTFIFKPVQAREIIFYEKLK